MSARYLRALAALACAACSMPDAAFFDLPVEPQHQAGLLVLGNQVHALSFEDGVLVDAPVRVAPDDVPNEVFFYAYQRSLAELGLQPGLQDLALEGGRLLPTPARSLQTQKTPVAWSPLAERWAGPIVDLRIEAPGGCLSSVETTRSIASTEPPLFAVALGAEGTWEETTLLVGLRGGALYAVTAETIQPIDQPVGDDVCNGPCRIGPIFRGFGRTLWFTYANTRTIALRGAVYRSDFDLEARAFERVHEVRRSAFDFAAIELTGPRRAPVERLDLFSARYNDVRKEFLGHVSRYTFAGEPPALDEPLAFTTPAPNNSVRFVDSDLAFVSREHTAALWPFAPERNVAYTAYALQERAATSSVTQITFVPELGLVLGDASGGLSVHPTRLGAAPEPIASSMSSEVLALESIVGGFVAVERGSLWHHRVTDGTSTVCPRVSVQAEASAFVVEVGDALVVVSSVGDSVAVEWLAPPEGA